MTSGSSFHFLLVAILDWGDTHDRLAVLVTGGSGLVGRAVEYVIDNEPVGSKFGRKDGETWIFLGSKDGNLK